MINCLFTCRFRNINFKLTIPVIVECLPNQQNILKTTKNKIPKEIEQQKFQ